MSKAAPEKLNGSTELLAKAMQSAFADAVERGLVPVRKEIKDGLDELRSDFNERLDTTDRNVQEQLASHRKDVAADFKEALRNRS